MERRMQNIQFFCTPHSGEEFIGIIKSLIDKTKRTIFFDDEIFTRIFKKKFDSFWIIGYFLNGF